MSRRRFVIRTIKNGSVKIYGITYKPDLDATKFDGMRAAFGLYWIGDKRQEDFVSLWGSEKMYKYDGNRDDPRDPEIWPGPFCEDHIFKWEWWDKI